MLVDLQQGFLGVLLVGFRGVGVSSTGCYLGFRVFMD